MFKDTSGRRSIMGHRSSKPSEDPFEDETTKNVRDDAGSSQEELRYHKLLLVYILERFKDGVTLKCQYFQVVLGFSPKNRQFTKKIFFVISMTSS